MLTISSIQEELRDEGLYDGKIDGDWGPKTSSAYLWSLNHKGIHVPKYLEAAFADLYLRETPGPKATPRIAEMHKHTSLQAESDEVAWCSAAMCTWMEENGLTSTRSAAARSWLQWGRATLIPQPGAVTVLRRGNSEWEGHVALYLKGDGDQLALLGGNQSNMVNVKIFPKTQVLGYRMPK